MTLLRLSDLTVFPEQALSYSDQFRLVNNLITTSAGSHADITHQTLPIESDSQSGDDQQ